MKIFLLVVSNHLNNLRELTKVKSPNIKFIVSHRFQERANILVLQFGIIKSLKRTKDSLWLRLINAIFKQSETIFKEIFSVQFSSISLFLKFLDVFYIIKSLN
jgi:hypothetical protein